MTSRDETSSSGGAYLSLPSDKGVVGDTNSNIVDYGNGDEEQAISSTDDNSSSATSYEYDDDEDDDDDDYFPQSMDSDIEDDIEDDLNLMDRQETESIMGDGSSTTQVIEIPNELLLRETEINDNGSSNNSKVLAMDGEESFSLVASCPEGVISLAEDPSTAVTSLQKAAVASPAAAATQQTQNQPLDDISVLSGWTKVPQAAESSSLEEKVDNKTAGPLSTSSSTSFPIKNAVCEPKYQFSGGAVGDNIDDNDSVSVISGFDLLDHGDGTSTILRCQTCNYRNIRTKSPSDTTNEAIIIICQGCGRALMNLCATVDNDEEKMLAQQPLFQQARALADEVLRWQFLGAAYRPVPEMDLTMLAASFLDCARARQREQEQQEETRIQYCDWGGVRSPLSGIKLAYVFKSKGETRLIYKQGFDGFNNVLKVLDNAEDAFTYASKYDSVGGHIYSIQEGEDEEEDDGTSDTSENMEGWIVAIAPGRQQENFHSQGAFAKFAHETGYSLFSQSKVTPIGAKKEFYRVTAIYGASTAVLPLVSFDPTVRNKKDTDLLFRGLEQRVCVEFFKRLGLTVSTMPKSATSHHQWEAPPETLNQQRWESESVLEEGGHEIDVICTDAKFSNQDPANLRYLYQAYIQDYRERFQALQSSEEKSALTQSVIRRVREHGGKFVKYNKQTSTWEEVALAQQQAALWNCGIGTLSDNDTARLIQQAEEKARMKSEERLAELESNQESQQKEHDRKKSLVEKRNRLEELREKRALAMARKSEMGASEYGSKQWQEEYDRRAALAAKRSQTFASADMPAAQNSNESTHPSDLAGHENSDVERNLRNRFVGVALIQTASQLNYIPETGKAAIVESLRFLSESDVDVGSGSTEHLVEVILEAVSGSPNLTNEQRAELTDLILQQTWHRVTEQVAANPGYSMEQRTKEQMGSWKADFVDFRDMIVGVLLTSRRFHELPIHRKQELVGSVVTSRSKQDLMGFLTCSLHHLPSLDEDERGRVANDVLDRKFYNLLLPDRLNCDGSMVERLQTATFSSTCAICRKAVTPDHPHLAGITHKFCGQCSKGWDRSIYLKTAHPKNDNE